MPINWNDVDELTLNLSCAHDDYVDVASHSNAASTFRRLNKATTPLAILPLITSARGRGAEPDHGEFKPIATSRPPSTTTRTVGINQIQRGLRFQQLHTAEAIFLTLNA